jgi:hypothetical protein
MVKNDLLLHAGLNKSLQELFVPAGAKSKMEELYLFSNFKDLLSVALMYFKI